MITRVSNKGKHELMESEGYRTKGYLDAAGLLTIGVGHLVKPGEPYKLGVAISKQEVEDLFTKDLKSFEDFVSFAVKEIITQNQFDALVSLCFNIGKTAFKNSTVLRRVIRGDFKGAASAFLMWNKIRKRGKLVAINGLMKRRQRERALFLTPDK